MFGPVVVLRALKVSVFACQFVMIGAAATGMLSSSSLSTAVSAVFLRLEAETP